MVLLDVNRDDALLDGAREPFPHEVEFIISALEAGPRRLHDRHKSSRSRCRVKATLRLFSDASDTPAWALYTRNVSPQGMGFLSDACLPLSHGGVVHLLSPRGKLVKIACTILRCRQVAPGWFEGAIYFNREQDCFAADEMP